VTSIPLVSRTRATFRSAEFGFLGVEVYTRVQTPRFWGQLFNAGLEVFQAGGLRPLRTSWLNVGTNFLFAIYILKVVKPTKRPGTQKENPETQVATSEDYLASLDRPMFQSALPVEPRGLTPGRTRYIRVVAQE
jgi:hypothetical protein